MAAMRTNLVPGADFFVAVRTLHGAAEKRTILHTRPFSLLGFALACTI
jgi:hypothetical protein